MAPLKQLRLRAAATHLHELGARALSEFLAEIATAHGCEDELLDRLAAYQRISATTLKALGGDRFPPVMHAVPSARSVAQ